MAMKKNGKDKPPAPSMKKASPSAKKKLNELTQATYASDLAKLSKVKGSSPSASTRSKTAANRSIIAREKTSGLFGFAGPTRAQSQAISQGYKKSGVSWAELQGIKPAATKKSNPRRGTR